MMNTQYLQSNIKLKLISGTRAAWREVNGYWLKFPSGLVLILSCIFISQVGL